MTRSRLLAVAVAAAGLGMLGPASQAVAEPGMVEPGCVVRDATLSWGFKESFRAYIESDIANGEWTTGGGATYETPEFSWAPGTGHYDPETGIGYVQFPGAVRFTGHEGLLDSTIADPALSLTADSAFLYLDVSGPSMEGEQIDASDVSFVELPDVEVAGEGVRLTLTSGSVMTADGEAAFPDYQAGTDFDPITVELKLDNCSVISFEPDETSASTPAWVIAGAVLGSVAVLVVVAVLLAVRRRARA